MDIKLKQMKDLLNNNRSLFRLWVSSIKSSTVSYNGDNLRINFSLLGSSNHSDGGDYAEVQPTILDDDELEIDEDIIIKDCYYYYNISFESLR